MKTTIAQNMIEIMKQHNRTTIWYGDLDLIEECAKKSHIPHKHPQNLIQQILNALDRSPNFSKCYIYSDVTGKSNCENISINGCDCLFATIYSLYAL